MTVSYTSLGTQLAAELKRTDLTTNIAQFIEFAEFQLARDLRMQDGDGREIWPRGFEKYTSFAFTSGSSGATIDPPTRILDVIAFHVLTDSTKLLTGSIRQPVMRRSYSWTRAYNPNQSTTGCPKYWCDMGGNKYLVAPSPVVAFTAELDFYERPAPLTALNTTNWYTDEAPQLILYGALLQSAPYLKDDERVATWQAIYDRALSSVIASEGGFNRDEAGQA